MTQASRLLVPVLALSTVVVATGRDHKVDADDLNGLLARARKLGLATSADEANARLAAATDNAASALLKLAQNKKLPGYANRLFFSKDVTTSRQVMKEIGSGSASFDQVTKHAGYSPKRDWRQGAAMMMPELSALRDTAKFLCGRAKLRAWQQRGADSLKDLASVLRVIPHPWYDKNILGALTQISIISFWSSSAAEIAPRLSQDQLGTLAKLAASIKYVDYRDAFSGEIVITRVEIEKVRAGKISLSQLAGRDTQSEGADRIAPQFADAGEIATLSFIVDAAENWHDWRKIMLMDDAFMKKMEEKKPEYIFPTILAPIIGQFKLAELRTNAWLDTTRIGIAALQMQKRTVKWPTLSQAAKAAGTKSVDPFDSREYGYRASSAELLVYSFGPDGKDDKGARKQQRDATYDVAQFHLKLPGAK